ncbi:DnaJ domain-containing protein, partial [uncultured Spongiibacter sp.]
RQYVMNHVYKKLSASNGNEQQEAPRKETPAVDMNESQALAILGLKAGASADDIVRAHRSLMQKLHPDRGGNDYLASQLNAAKELLLKNHA